MRDKTERNNEAEARDADAEARTEAEQREIDLALETYNFALPFAW